MSDEFWKSLGALNPIECNLAIHPYVLGVVKDVVTKSTSLAATSVAINSSRGRVGLLSGATRDFVITKEYDSGSRGTQLHHMPSNWHQKRHALV